MSGRKTPPSTFERGQSTPAECGTGRRGQGSTGADDSRRDQFVLAKTKSLGDAESAKAKVASSRLQRDSNPDTRSDSTDSGLASGSATKRRSMDSNVSNRIQNTESDSSSPEGYTEKSHPEVKSIGSSKSSSNSTGNKQNARLEMGVAPNAVQAGHAPRDDDLHFHGKAPVDEKYLSTASDRAADHEVSYIMMTSSSPSTLWDEEQVLPEEEDPVNDEPLLHPHNTEPQPQAHSTTASLPRNRKHGAFARQLKKESSSSSKSSRGQKSEDSGCDVTNKDTPLFDGKAFKRIESGKYNSHRNAVTSYQHPQLDEAYDSDVSRRSVKKSSSSCVSSSAPRSSLRPSLSESGTVAASTGVRPFSETSKGISSSDTHRSSVRYEPVAADSFGAPPSPGNHPSNRRQLLGNASSESDLDDDDVIRDLDDVVDREEEQRPLNTRRRMSSPLLDQRMTSSSSSSSQQPLHFGGRRGSSYMARANSGNLLVPKSGATSSSNDPRHHPGLPRMGTGAMQQPSMTSQNSVAASSSLYSQQTPSSVMTSRVAAPLTPETDQYDPVVTTTLKPTYEVDETGMWNFSRGTDSDRSAFGGYTPGVVPGASLPPHTASTAALSAGAGVGGTSGVVVPGANNTTARFMNKRPSVARHFDSSLHHHHRRESRQFAGSGGGFKSFKNGFWRRCSWRCAAVSFIVLSLLLGVALLAFLLGLFNSSTTVIEVDDPLLCGSTGGGVPSHTTVTKQGGPIQVLQFRRTSPFEVAPGAFRWMQIYVEEPSHIKFNCSLSPKAQVAVYGRKGLRPSHTKFNFFERIDADSLPSTRALTTSFATFAMESSARKRRSVSSSSSSEERRVNTGFMEYMEPGTWHLAVFNDGTNEELFEIQPSISGGLSKCPHNCKGKGDCIDGRCHCFAGFQGSDCSQVSCSIHCRGNGVYAHGKCVCFSGWKGVDCGTQSDQCIEPDCAGHGTCGADGECVCQEGFKGISCEEIDCLEPTCSGHGLCLAGVCRCDRGWVGVTCKEPDTSCPADCSGRGIFDKVSSKCVCYPGWGGSDCRTDLKLGSTNLNHPSRAAAAVCRPACHSEHGTCVDGTCRCEDGWTGDACDVKQCPAKCAEHGACVNGLCVCDLGWNGLTCSFAGCEKDCSGNGNCIRDSEGDYYCSCSNGWKGPKCDVEVELQCTDGRDNDHDTLADCQDPDCCSHRSCSRSAQCRGSLDPIHEISRIYGRSPLTDTSSFFDRVRFLVHSNGIQEGAQSSQIDARRASVIRGRVLTADGSPLIGAKVAIMLRPEFGSTKTRADGWFDILVNGGGSFELSFQRTSFVPATVSVFAPWNDYVIAPTVSMRTPSQPKDPGYLATSQCDSSRLAPPSAKVLVSTVRAYTAAECSERGSVIPETQEIRQSVNLPGSETSLVYLSGRAPGYQSILSLLLIDGEMPANLLQVHIRIVIQGRLFTKRMEPESSLRFTYEWPRVDAYDRPVYGPVSAKVLVGYEYESCSDVVWTTLVTTLHGRPSIDLWSLDIHHSYHPDAGIVYLGNGGQMRLRDQPPMMSTVMGDGLTRHASCDRCDGPATRTQLLSPVALASDAAGNIYVGDHNFIRKIDVHGNATSLYSTRSAPAKYYMAMSPVANGVLYFSNPNEHRIYRLRRMDLPRNRRSRDLFTNSETVAGTGATCYPLQKDDCGNGGQATSARLSAPKGLALDKNGVLYFVDGTRIRTVDPRNGEIATFAGSLLVSGTRPLPCSGSISLDQIEFTFPTDLALSHVDGALYVLDGDVIVRIDVTERQASLAAGVPVHCTRWAAKKPDYRNARKVSLISPTSLSVSPLDGALFVSETDQRSVHRVRRVDPYNGRISTVAGVDSKCDCALQDCQCFAGDANFARSASLHNPTAVTATPDGSVYVADQLNLRIRKVVHSLPRLSAQGEYNVADPDTNQLYAFDRNGRHVETRNVITGSWLYNFAYSSEGKLNAVRDVNGNTLQIDFGSNGVPVQIALPNGNTLGLSHNSASALTKITQGFSSPLAVFKYQGEDSGLIRSSVIGRFASSFYVYDVHGRLITAVSPTGAMTSLHRHVNATRHTVTMETAATAVGTDPAGRMGVGRRDVVVTTEPGYLCDLITTTEGAMVTTYKRWTDNSISVHYLDDSDLIFETKPHPVLGLTAPFLAKRTIHLPSDPLENEIVWRTRKEKDIGSHSRFLLGRRMAVNGRNILSLDYSQGHSMEKIYDDHTKFMLRVQYNQRGLPTLWMPSNEITPVNVTYDPRGHAATWQRGPHTERVRYDSNGNVESVRKADGYTWRYSYGNKVAYLTLPGANHRFTFTYDASGNLRQLATPSGLSYTLRRRIGVGFLRTTFTGPDGADLLVLDNNDRGNPLSVFYPGDKRKAIFRYDAHGHMTEVLHDGALTRMLRDPQSGELVSVATDDCTLRYHRNGPLVTRHTVTSSSDGGVLATFEYANDVNLRLESIQVRVNDTRLPKEDLLYDDVSGKLTTFGPYKVIDFPGRIYSISTPSMTLSKQSNNNGKIREAELVIFSVVVFNIYLSYDAAGRISSQDVKIGIEPNNTRMVYSYSRSGALESVALDGARQWRYMYDADGRLNKIQREDQWTTLRYDRLGRLASCGDLQYSFDADGFLQQRGNEVFEYDSMGYLTRAYRLDHGYEIKYGYDGFGRLTTRVNVKSKEVIRYLYADLSKPALLTHTFNATSGLVTTYRYDVEGHVFAMERSDGEVWPVVCDHLGTPLAVFDRSRKLVKRIKYSPFGQVIDDSAPFLFLAIGFRGGIYDVTTGLVRFADRALLSPTMTSSAATSSNLKIVADSVLGKRSTTEQSTGQLQNPVDYDAIVGQFTSSGVAQLKDQLGAAPTPFAPFQVADPANHVPVYGHMTDTASWLNALGFKLQNVAPDPQIASRQKDKSSVECQLSHHLRTYMSLQTATPSALVPTRSGAALANVPDGTLFAQGLIFVVDRGAIATRVLDSASDDVKRLSGIVNGADVIFGQDADSASAAMSLTIEGKPNVFLSKPGDAFDKDKQTLRLTPGHERVLQGRDDVSGGDVSGDDVPIVVSTRERRIRIETGYAVVTVVYVSESSSSSSEFTTSEVERDRIASEALRRAEQEMWKRERSKINRGMRTRWSPAEEREIRRSGSLSSYSARFAFDTERYPELADSGRNIRLARRT